MRILVRVATLAIVAFTVVALSACSNMLRLNRDVEERADLRQNYLQNNPDGAFNNHIVKSEVVKGMNVIEVLASWGLPDVRTASKTTKAEFWTYFTVDDYSQTVSSYDLVFEDRQLRRWVVAIDVVTLEDFHKRGMFDQESTRIATEKPGGLSGDTGSLSRR